MDSTGVLILRAFFMIVIAMFSIQYGASVAKGLFPLAGPTGTTALRVFFSAVILFFVARPYRFKIPWDRLPVIAVYGISLGAMNLLFYLSLVRIPLGVAVALEFTGPLAVALFSSKKLSDLVWAFFAAVGIYLILPKVIVISFEQGSLDLFGVLLALGAGVFWALYIVFGKMASREGDIPSTSSWGMGFAALVAVPVGLYYQSEAVFSPTLWPMGILVAILSSALPYSLELKAMQVIPAKTFGILMSMEPVIATLMGFLFLRERLSVTQTSAIFCIVIASAGSTMSMRSGK